MLRSSLIEERYSLFRLICTTIVLNASFSDFYVYRLDLKAGFH